MAGRNHTDNRDFSRKSDVAEVVVAELTLERLHVAYKGLILVNTDGSSTDQGYHQRLLFYD